MNRLFVAVLLVAAMFTPLVPAAFAHHESSILGLAPATRNRMADLEHRFGRLEGRADHIDGRLKAVESKVARHEASIARLERSVRTATKLTGSLAELAGVHHAEWPLVIEGFRTASADLTPAMKARLSEVSGLVKSGEWQIEYVAAFADTRPWKDKSGNDLNGPLADDRAMAGARYLEGALGLDVDSIPALGRGPTMKFGSDLDLNRGLLVHLKKVVPATPPAALPSGSTQ